MLVANEVDSSDVTYLQVVKLLALYLLNPDNKVKFRSSDLVVRVFVNYNTNAPIFYSGVDTPSSIPTSCNSQSSIIHNTPEVVKDNMPDLLSDIVKKKRRRTVLSKLRAPTNVTDKPVV
nr:hypothetical protein [Tanacetum cinerariifolium]